METESWNPDRMGRLTTLYQEGLSFSLIAADIGVTRNAAIGKAHRMNLPRRETPPSQQLTQRRPGSTPRRHKIAKPTAPSLPFVVPGKDYSCTIEELTDSSCRYPLWEISAPHDERRYCGIPGASFSEGFPYCRRHAVLCFGSAVRN